MHEMSSSTNVCVYIHHEDVNHNTPLTIDNDRVIVVLYYLEQIYCSDFYQSCCRYVAISHGYSNLCHSHTRLLCGQCLIPLAVGLLSV